MSINIGEICEKYQKDINYITGNTEHEIFKSFYLNIDKTHINNWVNKTFTKTSIKDDKQSQQYRNIGNKNFNQGHLDTALENYNKSINFAVFQSENYYLAIANRSAVFYEQNKFFNSISDIRVCFNPKYPEQLKYKLHLRLINCYKQLHDLENAQSCLELFKKYLEKNPEITLKKDQLSTLEYEINQLNASENKIDTENLLPDLEKNPDFFSASNKITLKFSTDKGRYVTATENIKIGDILFIEKAFSFVPIYEKESNYCYHCFKTTENLYPCENCNSMFCSFDCLRTSWSEYHRFECTGSCVGLWPMVGVNFLANRILLLGAHSGFKNVFLVNQNKCILSNNYDSICSLVTNIEKMDKGDVFPHIVGAILITTYLRKKTDFFDYLSEILDKLDSKVSKNIDSMFTLVGSVLLKHCLQVIANATSIENVENNFYKNINSLKRVDNSGIEFCGVGLYPSVSMMNHSCSTNISNYFVNDYIIVKAKSDIAKGSEVFNSYGYDSSVQSTVLRQQELKRQYYFDCKCTSCTFPTEPEKYKDNFRCIKCEDMCLKIGFNYECVNCKYNFDPTNYLKYLEKAQKMEIKYNSNEDINLITKIYNIHSKIFYKYNLSLYTTYLNLQDAYFKKGDLVNWMKCTKNSLEINKNIFGGNSLKYVFDIRTNILLLLEFIKNLHKFSVNKEILLELRIWFQELLENMKKIFFLYYNSNKINFTLIENEILKAKNIIELVLSQKTL